MGKTESGMSINVDENLVMPVIEKQIQVAVLRELGKMDDLLPKMIDRILHEKVNSEGKSASYGADHDWIDITFRKALQSAAREAIIEHIQKNMPAMRRSIKAAMSKSTSDLARAFTEGIENAMKSDWSFRVEVTPPVRD